ncbi:hypothetical protein vseg_008666 [Gypsophila vaccaria]
MRREGRLHEMVRTLTIQPAGRVQNKVEASLTADLFTKVPPKPTSHSKIDFIHPTVKSKDKSKGSLKIKSGDNKLSYKVIGWSVLPDDRSDKTLVAGNSASKILEDLYHDDDNYNNNNNNNSNNNHDDYNDDDEGVDMDEKVVVETGDDVIVHERVMPDDDDGYHGFYDISNIFSVIVHHDDDVDDDGWSLVGGM